MQDIGKNVREKKEDEMGTTLVYYHDMFVSCRNGNITCLNGKGKCLSLLFCFICGERERD